MSENDLDCEQPDCQRADAEECIIFVPDACDCGVAQGRCDDPEE